MSNGVGETLGNKRKTEKGMRTGKCNMDSRRIEHPFGNAILEGLIFVAGAGWRTHNGEFIFISYNIYSVVPLTSLSSGEL